MQQLLVNKDQAAQVLGISRRQLERLMERCEISPRRVGRRVLFRPSDLEKFAEASE